jgi:RES domain-containing protein
MIRSKPFATDWAGVAYRSVVPRYASSQELLSGHGSRQYGGRWNPPESFPAVYASLDPETALAEALAHCRHYGIPVEHAMPRVFVAIRAELARVLDLNDGAIRRSLRVSRGRMCEEDWRACCDAGTEAITQALGRIARQIELDGLLVPSAALADGTNLVVFPDNLSTTSSLAIIRPEDLPR